MGRKSPFRHKVRTYTRRDGTRVGKYERGKGKKPRESMTGGGRKPSARKPSKSSRKVVKSRGKRSRGVRAPSTPFRNFNVRVTFPDGRSESVFGVNSTSYAGAITKGLTKRERGDAPKSLLIRRVL